MEDATRKTKTDCRLARTQDTTLLARMSRDYVETGLGWSWRANRINRLIHAPDSVVVCAERSAALTTSARQICGFAIMEFGIDRAHLNLLAVMPTLRRQGVARTLMTWLEKSAAVAGTTQIDLEVRATNEGALSFYEALDFRLIDTVPAYYNGRENAHRLRKQLFEAPPQRDAQTNSGAQQP